MKKGIVFTGLLLLTIGGFCQAQGDLGIDIDTTYVSKYIWRGFDLLDDKSATQPSVTIDLFGSGFSATVWASYANSSRGGANTSMVNATEYDYILTYSRSAFEGEVYQMDYAVNWIYYDFIDNASSTQDAQEWNLAVAFPQICGFGIVPNYTAAYIYNSEGKSYSNNITGWFHKFGLDYNIVLGEVIPNNPEQVITFSWDITYNDGAGASGNELTWPKPGGVDHDWSHMTWGLSTDIACPVGTLRPGVYYQTSMDDSVNTEDEFWTGVSYSLSF